MIARPQSRPTPLAPTEEVHALLALAGGGEDGRLRALLLALRRARIAEARAIEAFLGLSPARSERGAGRELGEEGRR